MTPSIWCKEWLLALLVFLASTPDAALADFTPVSDDRSVHADYFDPYYSDVQDDSPTVAFAAWLGDETAGGTYWATLDSEAVTATRMAATGTANGFSEFGSASAVFSITFDVRRRHRLLALRTAGGGLLLLERQPHRAPPGHDGDLRGRRGLGPNYS